MMSYSAAVEPLRAANLLAGRSLYDVRFLPAVGASAQSSGGATVKASAHIGEQMDFDLMLVVAGGVLANYHNPNVFSWLRHLARRKMLIGGVSGGPMILALAGIMGGRRMTLHWDHAAALGELMPSLMIERTLYVMDRDRMTCAGGIAPLDMMHALIAEQHGLDFARQVSDWFMHTDIRPAWNPQRAGIAERFNTTDAALLTVIEVMENHLADPLDLNQLAYVAGLSARQLNRLFKNKLRCSTIAFYRDLRLQKACNLLSQSPLSVTEISLATGFVSGAHFSKCFKKKYDVAPSVLRV